MYQLLHSRSPTLCLYDDLLFVCMIYSFSIDLLFGFVCIMYFSLYDLLFLEWSLWLWLWDPFCCIIYSLVSSTLCLYELVFLNDLLRGFIWATLMYRLLFVFAYMIYNFLNYILLGFVCMIYSFLPLASFAIHFV